MINQYTIFGQPIAHSLSPAIHHMFGELTQRRVNYTRTEATESNFAELVQAFKQAGGKGCNVTAPFKELAVGLCDRLHDSAKLAQAVNTIEMHRDGSMVGHNTDGNGLLIDLTKNCHQIVKDKRILMVGAGGAARGAIAPLLDAGCQHLHVANRTVERAQHLADNFAELGSTSASSYEALQGEAAFDIIINATSMGFDNDAPPLPLSIFNTDAFAYDMMYSKDTTPFVHWCESNKLAKCKDGFGMLVEQAADAYLIWEGVRPKTRKVYLQTDQIVNSV